MKLFKQSRNPNPLNVTTARFIYDTILLTLLVILVIAAIDEFYLSSTIANEIIYQSGFGDWTNAVKHFIYWR